MTRDFAFIYARGPVVLSSRSPVLLILLFLFLLMGACRTLRGMKVREYDVDDNDDEKRDQSGYICLYYIYTLGVLSCSLDGVRITGLHFETSRARDTAENLRQLAFLGKYIYRPRGFTREEASIKKYIRFICIYILNVFLCITFLGLYLYLW